VYKLALSRFANCQLVAALCARVCLPFQAFKQLDKDGSGTISIDELTEACR
jgi:hypothetical protein